MKKFKRIMALVIALAMVLGMTSMAAFAVDTPTGTITVTESGTVGLEGKVLRAYKILDATYDTKDTPTDESDDAVAYTIPAEMKIFYDSYFKGSYATATAAAAAAGITLDYYVSQQIAALDTAETLRTFLDAAYTYAKTNVTPIEDGTGDNIGKFTGLRSGYYIIADETTVDDDHPADTISALMLDTVKEPNPTIILKANKPSPDKVIETASGDVESNSVTVGSKVNYKITEKVPNYTGYDHFYYILNDTLSEGLTLDPASIKVYVDDVLLTNSPLKTRKVDGEDVSYKDYYLYLQAKYRTGEVKPGDGEVETAAHSFEIAFGNIKDFTIGKTIKVTYSAYVNDSALTGVDPNTNSTNVTYSNNPNVSEDKDKDNKPGIPASTSDNATGTGPTDWTATYTTEIQINKVDENDNAIQGVEFTLTGTSTATVLTQQEYFEQSPTGTYWLLKDGTYTTDAPTSASMVTAGAGARSGYVQLTAEEASYAGNDLIEVNGIKYRAFKETDAGKDVYILNLGNETKYESAVIKYEKKTGGATVSDETIDVKKIGITDSTGKIVFDQLGSGTYTLEETKVPTGYNKAANITVTLTPTLPADITTGGETCTWTKTAVLNADDVTEIEESGEGTGKFTVKIVNNKGTELPSTGGIGTTIFYVVGAILVIGAGVILITRRRMDA